MLRKNVDIQIDHKDPFASDKLNREQSIKNLTLLIRSLDQPFVLAIEAPWGQGKTTFVKLWRSHLESLSLPCVYFNAWETDYVDDPLLPFIAEMKPIIEAEILEHEDARAIKEKWQSIRRIGGGILRKTIPLGIQLLSQGLLSQENIEEASEIIKRVGEEISEYAAEYAEERIQKYEQERNSIVIFRQHLEELAAVITGEDAPSPLIFFIDELDRCRPDYGLALLERIKHLFSVRGIVFVLSIDRQQLRNSIRAIYGDGMDTDGYLRRFIDLSFRLPDPDVKTYSKYLFGRFELQDAFKGRQDARLDADSLLKGFSEIAVAFKLSLRVVEQCFTEINLVIRTTSPKYRIFSAYLALLVSLKAHIPEIYEALRGQMSRKDLDEVLLKLSELPIDKNLNHRFEASLISGYLQESEIDKYSAELTGLLPDEGTPKKQWTEEQSRARNIVDAIQNDFRGTNRTAIRYLVSRIEMTRDFLPEVSEIEKLRVSK